MEGGWREGGREEEGRERVREEGRTVPTFALSQLFSPSILTR
jgi:hypothetical protein